MMQEMQRAWICFAYGENDEVYGLENQSIQSDALFGLKKPNRYNLENLAESS
ncbi:predicted protein [Sclerotinia sclerotiorum 1980 UF-70]|uniref:Uncharacterized protein n=1 Tax=Sclerotinia sclerotiorum (strain ATCC 18683 / 1980 / Ss-1) TaxID=665079 RepID=A7EWA9_SCLS1|nr:predicted protein [Sclerotinia sclerotiorum 1980 UF-70]EDN93751.1 predicted protein [Sclerotinia sclerotiorum 1980 UF-70]